MTCLENVMLGRYHNDGHDLRGTLFRFPFTQSRQERRIYGRALEILEFMGIGGSADRMASELSWMEKQLLQISRALVGKPKILLLDEPTAGMGEQELRFVQGAIEKISEIGMTIIVVAHDMRLIMEFSDRVICLSFGTRIAEGTPNSVQNNPNVLEVYLGKE